ncbi:MAG: hypothetical protein NVSMB17_05110 [Candidatus Dormibacteria bacterium]
MPGAARCIEHAFPFYLAEKSYTRRTIEVCVIEAIAGMLTELVREGLVLRKATDAVAHHAIIPA